MRVIETSKILHLRLIIVKRPQERLEFSEIRRRPS